MNKQQTLNRDELLNCPVYQYWKRLCAYVAKEYPQSNPYELEIEILVCSKAMEEGLTPEQLADIHAKNHSIEKICDSDKFMYELNSLNTKTQSEKYIEKLRGMYSGDRFQFEMSVSQMLGGYDHLPVRVNLAEYITGSKIPSKKCTPLYIADLLKNKFDQLTLF